MIKNDKNETLKFVYFEYKLKIAFGKIYIVYKIL